MQQLVMGGWLRFTHIGLQPIRIHKLPWRTHDTPPQFVNGLLFKTDLNNDIK
jgi:hypothetical protein